ncbi:hypothetical protein [Aquipuribacter sp. SD81]|uniref:hypothetical protein n=1 Tax=Aquipuribacter sp. SD81 TaxID=3127703 RepID=UPI003015CC27
MSHTYLTVGVLVDAEVAYRQERVAADVAASRGVVRTALAGWRARRALRRSRREAELALAA